MKSQGFNITSIDLTSEVFVLVMKDIMERRKMLFFIAWKEFIDVCSHHMVMIMCPIN